MRAAFNFFMKYFHVLRAMASTQECKSRSGVFRQIDGASEHGHSLHIHIGFTIKEGSSSILQMIINTVSAVIIIITIISSSNNVKIVV
jgi:hypothetical protein